uniref:Uncharacterized protein n=1 Tax=viral metagenome TaxID=1070528 RepID=A0A6C0C8J3_9ZZZZ
MSTIPQHAITRYDPIDATAVFFAVNKSNDDIPGSTCSVKNSDSLLSESCRIWNMSPNVHKIVYPSTFCQKPSGYDMYVQIIIKYIVVQMIGLLFSATMLMCTSVTFHPAHRTTIFTMILLIVCGICIDINSLGSKKLIHLFGDGEIYNVRGKLYDSSPYHHEFSNQFELIEGLCDLICHYDSVTFEICERANITRYGAMIPKLLALPLVIISVVTMILHERHKKDEDLTIIPLTNHGTQFTLI